MEWCQVSRVFISNWRECVGIQKTSRVNVYYASVPKQEHPGLDNLPQHPKAAEENFADGLQFSLCDSDLALETTTEFI